MRVVGIPKELLKPAPIVQACGVTVVRSGAHLCPI